MRAKKASIHSGANPRKINPAWFTGRVRMTDMSGVIGSRGHNIYHVRFEGARTKIHAHNGDQILYVTKGRGSLETFSRKGPTRRSFGIKKTQRVPLRQGDMVFIPRGTLHTHGADGRGIFSHIAINIIPPRSAEYKTTWYESDFATHVTGAVK